MKLRIPRLTLWIVAVAAVVLAVIGVLGYLSIGRGSTAKEGPPAATQYSAEQLEQAIKLEEIRGHLISAVANAQAGQGEMAKVHAVHPIAEYGTAVEGALRSKKPELIQRFNQALNGPREALDRTAGLEQLKATVSEANSVVDQVSLALIPGDIASLPAFQGDVLAGLLAISAEEYEESFIGGQIKAVAEYQDGYGFFRRGLELWGTFEDEIRAGAPAEYKEIEEALDGLRSAFPGIAVPTTSVDPEKVEDMVKTLRHELAEATGFAEGGIAAVSMASSDKGATLGALVQHLDRALAGVNAGDSATAAGEMRAFRQEWTEVEGLVKAKSAQAYADTEDNMAKAYLLLTQKSPDLEAAKAVIAQMQTDLAPYATGQTRYGVFDAAIILLREGFEALLVIVALLAFLSKTGNAEKSRWIWAGGGLGVLVSILIAIIVNAAFAQASSGTNRELLEGIVGLVAAGMLLYVSLWLHSKSSLGAWQQYISNRTSAALARNSLFSLALVAFLAVFREGAETVLFYLGIAPSIAASSLLLGLALGAAGLTVLGVLIIFFGIRIPIRPFFLVASLLIYYLAFKFVGTGIHALQVSGTLPATVANYLPSNGFLGLFPTWETTFMQGLLLVSGAAFLLVAQLRRRLEPTAS